MHSHQSAALSAGELPDGRQVRLAHGERGRRVQTQGQGPYSQGHR